MRNLLPAAIICILLSGTGCGPVKFYSDPSLTKETGLKYYSLKPFIRVERDQPGGNIVKAEIIYLPDLSNPQFLMVKDGPGSRKVDPSLRTELSDNEGTKVRKVDFQ